MSNGIKVVKRAGHIEPLDLEKMHKMVEQACEGLAGVSASQVEIQSGIQFYDGINTSEIQGILVKSASDLIDLEFADVPQNKSGGKRSFLAKVFVYSSLHLRNILFQVVFACRLSSWPSAYQQQLPLNEVHWYVVKEKVRTHNSLTGVSCII